MLGRVEVLLKDNRRGGDSVVLFADGKQHSSFRNMQSLADAYVAAAERASKQRDKLSQHGNFVKQLVIALQRTDLAPLEKVDAALSLVPDKIVRIVERRWGAGEERPRQEGL